MLLSGWVCLAAIAISTGIHASDGELEHVGPADGPPSGELFAAPPLQSTVASRPLELSLTPMPPGTLGQTYYRPSHPVPDDEHPRTGMLAVRDHEKVPFLRTQSMSGIRMKSGIWLFESVRPLDPGACQIVRVEARQTSQDIEPYATKFVRLIPGRIVYLDF